MAKKNSNYLSGVPAKDGGNRKDPKISGAVPKPSNLKTTYGAGDGQGGPGVSAKDGGNRKDPAIANKIPLPSNHDSYNPPPK